MCGIITYIHGYNKFNSCGDEFIKNTNSYIIKDTFFILNGRGGYDRQAENLGEVVIGLSIEWGYLFILRPPLYCFGFYHLISKIWYIIQVGGINKKYIHTLITDQVPLIRQ